MRSSAEVEYRVLASVFAELTWTINLLHDLHVSSIVPALIYYDNRAAISIATNPTFHEQAEHIEIDYHFVGDLIARGSLKLLTVRSSSQLADMFTEPLSSSVW